MSILKDREYLNCFWDLATEDLVKRLNAGLKLLEFVQGPEISKDDLSYTAKRLVRGLSSSREAARQGFSMCLLELINANIIDINSTVDLLIESTKTNGSMKSGEERDFMLGKFFGCLVLIKSNQTLQLDHVTFIIDTFVTLLQWKGWIREAIAESIILLIQSISTKQVIDLIIPKVINLLEGSLQDYSAWQIVLSQGLLQLSKSKKSIYESLQSTLNMEEYKLTAQSFDTITPTLLASTSGFPKIHRIWYTVMSNIFSTMIDPLTPSTTTTTSNNHPAVTQRCTDLTSSQEELLFKFITFIDDSLVIETSHEKRGVAYHLLTELCHYCPVQLLSQVITKKVIRSIYSALCNKKHTLHRIAENTIKQLLRNTGTDNKIKLTIASIIVQHCGANFDQMTHTTTIQSLLNELHEDDVMQYIHLLLHTIYTQYHIYHQSTSTTTTTTGSNNISADLVENEEEKEEDSKEKALHTIKSSIDGMIALCKNTKLSHRYTIILTVCTALIRISYFDNNNAKEIQALLLASYDNSNNKTPSKEKKKNAKKSSGEDHISVIFGDIVKATNADSNNGNTDYSLLLKQVIDSLCVLEYGNTTHNKKETKGYMSQLGSYPTEMVTYASNKLFTLLSDIGLKSATTVTKDLTNTSVEKEKEKVESMTDTTTTTSKEAHVPSVHVDYHHTILCTLSQLFYFLTTHGYHIRVATETDDIDDYDDDDNGNKDEEKDRKEYQAILTSLSTTQQSIKQHIYTLRNTLISHTNSNEKEHQKRIQLKIKCIENLLVLLNESMFFVLANADQEIQTLETLISISDKITQTFINNPQMSKITISNHSTSISDDSDDENDDSEDSDDDEDEDDEDVLLQLFEVCMDYLSVSESLSIKFLRDTINQVWSSICENIVIPMDVYDAVIGVISNEEDDNEGEDGADEGDDEENESEKEDDEENESEKEDDEEENDDENDKDDESDEEEGQEATTNRKRKQSGTPNKTKSNENDKSTLKKLKASATQNDDIMIDEKQLINVLNNSKNENDDDEDDELDDEELQNILQHDGTPEQDIALAKLIELRKASRKVGLLQAQKRQFLVRTRAIDILEILLNPKNLHNTTLILSMLPSLLHTLTEWYRTASLNEGIQEARTFEQRLRTLIDEKICRTKSSSSNQNKQSSSEEAVESTELQLEDVENILNEISICLYSSAPSLRQVAISCIYKMIKYCHSLSSTKDDDNDDDDESETKQIQLLITTLIQNAFKDFKSHKNTKISRKFIEDLISRYPEYSVTYILPELVEGIYDGKGTYKQIECCELYNIIITKYKSMSISIQQHIYTTISTACKHISTLMKELDQSESAESTGSGKDGLYTKVVNNRMRVLFHAAEKVVTCLTTHDSTQKVSKEMRQNVSTLKDTIDTIHKKIISNGQINVKSGVYASILNAYTNMSTKLTEYISKLPHTTTDIHNKLSNDSTKKGVSMKKSTIQLSQQETVDGDIKGHEMNKKKRKGDNNHHDTVLSTLKEDKKKKK